jgi:hypothetical protein
MRPYRCTLVLLLTVACGETFSSGGASTVTAGTVGGPAGPGGAGGSVTSSGGAGGSVASSGGAGMGGAAVGGAPTGGTGAGAGGAGGTNDCPEGPPSPEAIAANQGVELESGIAVDGTHVYWAATSQSSIRRASKSAPAPQVVATPAQPRGIALDETYLYWAGGAGAIGRVPKAGGAFEIVAMGQTQAQAIAVDGTHVYWSRRDTPTVGSGGIYRALKAPNATAEIVYVVPFGEDHSIALDATHVYWVNAANLTVGRKEKTGTMAGLLAQGTEVQEGWDVAVDTTTVYFTEHRPAGRLRQVVLATLGVGNVGTVTSYHHGIALDADSLYFSRSLNATTYSVVRRSKAGTDEEALTGTLAGHPGRITVDCSTAYWIDAGGAGSVWRAAISP